MLASDNTEQLGEEMDRDPKRAGHGAYWRHLPYCWTQASSATETPVFPVCVCVAVPSSCMFTQVCLCCLYLHVFLCVCPHQKQRWRWQNMRLGGTRRGGTRHPQTRGDWSVYLCGAPVQNRNEERMAIDISGQLFQKSGKMLCSCRLHHLPRVPANCPYFEQHRAYNRFQIPQKLKGFCDGYRIAKWSRLTES